MRRHVILIIAAIALCLSVRAAESALTSTPFALRLPRASGAPLFTRLAPEVTGVTAINRYDDPQMWGAKYREYAFGSVGTGVTIGDYDGDGRPDLFLVSKTGANHLYRNLGDWHFEDVTERAGVGGPVDAWKTGAVFADVNNDGRLDLYVCRFDAPNLLYLNEGNATFVERAHASGLDVVDASVSASFADYDRDGWLDLFLVTNLRDFTRSPDGEIDRLFRNRGDGTFVEATAAAGLFGKAQGHAALWWDQNSDGWPDVYVTNDYGWPDQLLRNRGDGTFVDVLGAVVPHIPRYGMGGDVGDVNNDGLFDLFVADMMPTTRERDQRSLADARAHMEDVSALGVTPQYMRNALFVNTATGRCLEAAFLAGVAATDWTWSAQLEDFDNDGRVDLHVTNGMIREFFDVDLRARLDAVSPADVPRTARSTPVLRERNLAYRNDGDLHFTDVSAAWGLDQAGVSFGAAVGDLDGDGDLDLVYANYEEQFTLCRNESAEGHRVVVALRGTRSNRFGIGATVRIETVSGLQVRQLMAGRGYASSGEPIAHFGLGRDERIRRLTINWPSGAEQTFSDLAGNCRYTITEPTSASKPAPPSVAPAGSGQFVEVGAQIRLGVTQNENLVDELAAQPLLAIRHNRLGPGVALGDLNGDRRDDVVIGGTSGAVAKVFLSGSDGEFHLVESALSARDSAVADAAPLLIDADGDGRLDVFLAKGGVAKPADDKAYQAELFLNRGQGNFARAPEGTVPALVTSAGAVVAADFNRDGTLDIFVGGRVVPGKFPQTPRSALLRNRGGRFDDVADEIAPGLARVGMVTAALWSDVDGDGWIDLLLACERGGIRCWRNVEGKRFEDASAQLGFAAAGNGWWNSLAAADFNGDGKPDYVAGNLGLNTRYRASPQRPAILLTGAFDPASREEQLIEVEYDGDRLVPVRSRAILGRALPWVLKKFPTFKSYAAATMADIFPETMIESAQRLTATEFRSGVFLSQPDNTGAPFRYQPLPRLAQIAPIFGVATGDFDGDAHADIIVVGNSRAPIAEIGNFDGGLGLFLRGDGRGNFDAVPPEVSGIVVSGDAKSLAPLELDGDGWPELLVTRNDDRMLVFGNTGRAGRQSLRIALRGRPGNPTAIGARITLEFADGGSETGEIFAGSGYLSQSAAACVFGFPDTRPPARVRVRWPWGATTVVAAPARGGVVTISAPAQ